jgi:HAE1 family hydrophobic/amphiphilic exporter-1
VGRFLFQFGVTVAIAILLSLFVALTLTPMLCSRFLRHEERRKNRVFRKVGEGLDWTDRTYRRGLDWALANRWKAIGIAALLSIVGLALFIVLPKELTPEVDESGFMVISETPTSASVHYTDAKQRQLEQIILSVPEVGGAFSAVGLFGPVNQGFMFVNLRPAGERDRSQHEIMEELRGRLAAVPGITAYVSTFGSAFTAGAAAEPFQFVITGPELEGLQEYSDALMARLREEVPGITDMRTDMRLQKPEVRVELDRDKAAGMGLDAAEIARAINVLIGSQEATIYKEGGHRYDVRVRVEDRQRNQPADILALAARTESGDMVRLGNVVTLQEGTGINVINRRDRQRAITILANLQGASLGEAVNTAERVGEEILPDTYATTVAGASETFQQTFAALLFAIGLAAIITYMLLASQFESLVHPFTIMGAVPLASIGALGLLLVTGMSLNLYSFIGLILLIGLVVKNSILLVDYTNTLRARGRDRDTALREAGPVRLRPILMTSLTVIFGVAPIALGLSEGAELRQPMAIAVIGGLTTSTFLTLLVIPVLYSLMDDGVEWAKRRVHAIEKHGWRGGWSPAHPSE